VEWIPEEQFEEACALYDEVLPSKGTLGRRLFEWRKQHLLPWKHMDLLPHLIEKTLHEVRQRIRFVLDLPTEEAVRIETSTDMAAGGACWYEGNYRSLMQVKVDTSFNLRNLPDFVCHEGYPEHDTEFVLKEQHLYRERGYLEQCVGLILAPQAVMSEGLAMMASEMLFEPGEAEGWLAEQIYPEVGMETDTVDQSKIERAQYLLEGVGCNAAMMVSEVRDENEVKDYMIKYLRGASMASEFLDDLFHRGYLFTYTYGKRLLQP
jgi:hypothetical protein